MRESAAIQAESTFVSIVIPCRNEEEYIAECLESVCANDFDKDRLEILVVDGMSSDQTRVIVGEFAQRHPFIRKIDNPKRTIPAAMNIGASHARGQVLLKMDAHSTCPSDYIATCVRFLNQWEADNVGGVLEILPGSQTLTGKAIAQVLSHPFGSGNAHVKVGLKEPRWADTAAFGCYRKEILEKVGSWNEDLAGSSDLDFNLRLKKAGGKTLLVPDLKIRYYADPDLRSSWRHNFADGVWATYVLKFGSDGWALRHWVPLGFVSALLGSSMLSIFLPTMRWVLLTLAAAYLSADLLVSLLLCFQIRDFELLFPLLSSFAMRHLGHGTGALYGLVLSLIPGRHWSGRRTAKA